MIGRRVKKTRKDNDGDITHLCNPGSFWSPKKKSSAISEIENGTCGYYVQDAQGRKADVHVVNGPNGKYLRTDPNSNCRDNLDNLPNC